MATIAITSTSAYIRVEPGVANEDVVTAYRKLSAMESVTLYTGRKGTYVEVKFSDTTNWTFDMNKNRGKDATVNSVLPKDNADLCTLIASIMVA